MTSGTVESFNEQKRVGFIAPDDSGRGVFVHANALEQYGLSRMSEGARVSFDAAEDPRGGKTAVSTIRVVS